MIAVARTRTDLAAARRTLGAPVVLVPTMGALHRGHAALLRRAAELAGSRGSVVVTIFVNPMQFGAGEDFDRYPRPLEADLALCEQEGAALAFAPQDSEVYPREQLITVSPGPIGQILEGASRPGFFTGVLTVILKLFQLVQPAIAVFGEKDAQQLALVRRMSEDLDLGIDIVGEPIVRDADGLATSSRNVYLSATERVTALALPAALSAGAEARRDGPVAVLAAAERVLDDASRLSPPLAVDYLALVDPATFTTVLGEFDGEAVLLVAAKAGAVRLIDNMLVPFAGR